MKDHAIELLRAVDSVRGMPCRLDPLRTSGTIRTLKEKYLGEVVTDLGGED